MMPDAQQQLGAQLAELGSSIARLTDVVVQLAERAALPDSLGLTVEEAMRLARIQSRSAFYDWARRMRVKPYSRGLYRRRDIENAMARGAYVAPAAKGGAQ